MIIKAGTLKELQASEYMIPSPVYKEMTRIVAMLDEQYGADRDVETNDGGCVIYIPLQTDFQEFTERYMNLYKMVPELVYILEADDCYINALYLFNNEYGVNLFLPRNIAPPCIFRDIEQEGKER